MLAYQWQADSGMPVVFLHGLLGSCEDWKDVFDILQDFPQIRPLAIDLPFHNQSSDIVCRHFADVRQQLHQTLSCCLGSQPFYLVGYSLGGRIALDYISHIKNPSLRGVLLEGANIGLQSEYERQVRRQNDHRWATRFAQEPMVEVLQDWYQQPVFADLSELKRMELVQKRQNNDGKKIAAMLKATSLAEQDFLLSNTQQNVQFVIGENDAKFRHMVQQFQLKYHLIAGAGHNAHQANPNAFVHTLLEFIEG